MPEFTKRVEEGEPSGVLEVFTPTAVLRATKKGNTWHVEGNGGDVVSALLCNGWDKVQEASAAPKRAAQPSQPATPAAAPASAPSDEPAASDALDLLDNSVKVIEKLLRTGDQDHAAAYGPPTCDDC